MPNWPETALGEVLGVKHGYAFKGRYFDQGGPLRVITPGNFHERGGFRDHGVAQKSYSGPVPKGYQLPPGSLVVAMTEQAPGLLGSAALVPDDGSSWLHNQRIGLVTPSKERADQDFVCYLLNSPDVRTQINATATGTKVRHTAPKRIESVTVPLPPISDQRRIAAVLSAFDVLTEVNKRRIQLLEDLARSLYREWFVHFRHRHDQDSDSSESELGLIPRGWTVSSLGEVADLHRRSVRPGDGPNDLFEHFSIPAYDNGQRPRVERGKAIKSAKYRVDRPAVLLAKINPRIPRVWLTHPGTDNAIASTEFLVWTGRDVSNAWLWAFFTSDATRDSLVGAAGGTSTSHQRVKPGDIESLPVPVPPAEVREAFDSFVEPLLALAAELRDINSRVASTMGLVLPRLVTGQLDISDIDLGVLTPAESD